MAEMTLPSTREEALRWLREDWGWPGLRAVWRYLSTPPRYVVQLDNGQTVDLGSAEALLNQRRLRLAVFGTTHHLLKWVDQRYWDDVVRIIAMASEDREAPESEEFDWLRGLLESYLEECKPASDDDMTSWLAHHRMELPLIREGDVYINSVHLSTWAMGGRGSRMRPREMAFLLRRYGAELEQIHAIDGGRDRKRRYWRLPSGLIPEGLTKQITLRTESDRLTASDRLNEVDKKLSQTALDRLTAYSANLAEREPGNENQAVYAVKRSDAVQDDVFREGYPVDKRSKRSDAVQDVKAKEGGEYVALDDL
ncbi:hypothetical protein [Meiothermus ruber]|uniref:hypothetical protein n=1 Tax=Meiothermus ruber TaxID=277 RepID=UPI0005633B0D|nr:hypothetical protein [Meiothermus ruber]